MKIAPDVLDGLTDMGNPYVRYYTLTNLFGKSESSSEVRETKEPIMQEGFILSSLSHQSGEGHL
ncbi:MAG: hypothetical protein QW279_07025 [Candidatus Jordarchaeaceae archaeon]